MTSHELAIKLLQGPNMEVHLAYPAGDYWRATLAPPVVQIATVEVGSSTYHQTDVVVEEDDMRADRRTVIVLR